MDEPLLMIDAKGEAVGRLQELLDGFGIPQPGDVFQIFGSGTEAAVIAFQRSRGLEADGKVGPATWTAITAGMATVAPVEMAPAPVPQPGSLIVEIGLTAESRFNLTVQECEAPGAPARWSPATPGVHSPHSLHYEGRAFDASGTAEDMHAFTAWVDENHGTSLEELIHNPNGSIDAGRHQEPVGFWGAEVFEHHRDHVHLAV